MPKRSKLKDGLQPFMEERGLDYHLFDKLARASFNDMSGVIDGVEGIRRVVRWPDSTQISRPTFKTLVEQWIAEHNEINQEDSI